MDVQDFEQAILRLAFETDARITTASVAYYLGIPSRKANELLNELLEEGVLELDSDQEGNLYYRVPHKPEGSDALLPRLRHEKDHQVDAEPSEQPEADLPTPSDPRKQRRLSPSVMLVSATDEEDTEPVSPTHGPGTASGRPGASPQQPRADSAQRAGQLAQHAGRRDAYVARSDSEETGRSASASAGSGQPWAGHRSESQAQNASSTVRVQRSGADGWNQRRERPVRTRADDGDLFSGLTQRQAAPDASLDRCGSSSMIVSESVRCDPKPLPSRKPVLASCVDQAERRSRQATQTRSDQSEPLFGRAQSQSSMLAPTAGGELAMRGDEHLERPEHQPGMALLLSLILCGTGQIYNGEVSKGIMMMVLCFLLWFVLLGWVVHIWSIVDSVVVAERLNRSTG